MLSLSRNDTAEDVDSNNEKEKSYGYMLMERLTGSPDGRIDHVLQEKTFQHLYLSALGSHTFILVAIIGEIMILLSSFSDICTVIYLKSLQLMILKGCLFDCFM